VLSSSETPPESARSYEDDSDKELDRVGRASNKKASPPKKKKVRIQDDENDR